ncbi:hypothetical protein HMPREF9996_01669, partial [Aggregatibacter actinomycetemcomitans Y4]
FEPRSGQVENFRKANSVEQGKQGKAGRVFFLPTFALHEQRKSRSPIGRNPISI